MHIHTIDKYIYIYIYIYAAVHHAFKNVLEGIDEQMCMFSCVNIYVCAYIHVYMCVCVCVCVYIYMYVCISFFN